MALLLVNFPGDISSLRPQHQESAPQKTDSAGNQKQDPAQARRRPAPSFAFGLENGTPVQLRLTRNLSSAQDRTGDRVDFEVVEDIKVKETVVVPKGGIAWGTVTSAQPHRRMGRSGKIDVKIDEVRLVDGEKIPLRAVKEARGAGRAGLMTGAIVVSGILFFPVAPLFLFMHGKDISIPKGTVVTAYISGDTPLDPQHFAKDSHPPSDSSVPSPQPAPREAGEVPPK